MLSMRAKALTTSLFVLLVLTSTVLNAAETWRWTNVDRIVAFGDVHGAYDNLVSLLMQAQVIDADTNWAGGSTHLVSTGDILDRGPASRAVLDLLIKLEAQAQTAGGHVHVILGNHEVMNLSADLRYVAGGEYAAFASEELASAREAAFTRALQKADAGQDATAARLAFDQRYPPGFFAHRRAFSIEGRYGQWLAKRPFVIVINDTAFTHGGLSRWAGARSLDEINTQLGSQLANYMAAHAQLSEAGLIHPEMDYDEVFASAKTAAGNTALTYAAVVAAAKQLAALEEADFFGGDVPQWYRGNVGCNPLSEYAVIVPALARLGADRLVVSHTFSVDHRVFSRINKKIISIDTGMSGYPDHGHAAALVIESGAMHTVYLGEAGVTPLPGEPLRDGDPIRGLSFAELEDFLRNATITSTRDLPDGITRPQQLTLERNGITLDGLFKVVELDSKGSKAKRNKFKDADSHRYEVAAYEIDKLLGLNMVPVAVLREINGRQGALQAWIDNTVNQKEARDKGMKGNPWCKLEDQFQLLYMFDYLISNDDRNMTNMMHKVHNWQLIPIDHSLAFRNRTGWPRYYKKPPLELSDEAKRRLQSLTAANLQAALGDLLDPSQIEFVLKRRDLLVAGRTPK